MSTEMLRRAADLLRERAKVADPRNYPLPWGVQEAAEDHYGLASYVTCDGGKGDLTDPLDEDVARYIASMHPGVAIAVADWLDREAVRYDEILKDTQRPSRAVDEPPAIAYGKPDLAHSIADGHCRFSLAVARAYLGEQPTSPLPPYTRPTTCGECGDDLAPGRHGWCPDCFAMQDGA